MAEPTPVKETLQETVARSLHPHVSKMIRDGMDDATISRITGATMASIEKQRRLMEAHR
jgi:hypothetical protein